MKVHSLYLDTVFEKQKELVERAEKVLPCVDFDVMVGTGLSGALVIPLLAYALKKPFAIVRKTPEKSHSIYRTEGYACSRYIFVDDTISSGETRDCVRKEYEQFLHTNSIKPVYVGTYLYWNADYGQFTQGSD